MDLYANTEIREHAEHIVKNEVLACASSMVSTILQALPVHAFLLASRGCTCCKPDPITVN